MKKKPIMTIRSSRYSTKSDFCYRLFTFLLGLTFTWRWLFFSLQVLHKLKSHHETIGKVEKLSTDQQSTRSVNSSRTKVASLRAKPVTKSALDETSNCREQSLCSEGQKPFFSNIRHSTNRSSSPLPLCEVISRRSSKQLCLCVVQNFEGKTEKQEKPEKRVKINQHHDQPCNKKSNKKMGQDVGSCCAKYILCLFNFLFFVSIKNSTHCCLTNC